MRIKKVIPCVLEALFILALTASSVWGACLMWTDADYAKRLIENMNHLFGYSHSTDAITVAHKLLYSIPALLLSAFFIFCFARQWITREEGDGSDG